MYSDCIVNLYYKILSSNECSSSQSWKFELTIIIIYFLQLKDNWLGSVAYNTLNELTIMT